MTEDGFKELSTKVWQADYQGWQIIVVDRPKQGTYYPYQGFVYAPEGYEFGTERMRFHSLELDNRLRCHYNRGRCGR